ncbi:MAG: SRPBCC family protein [Acidimicrobiia bacterium]
MAGVVVSQRIDAGPERVWEVLADLEHHPSWMLDARSVVITSPMRRGVGTTMEVATRIGPLRAIDVMVVTGWEEGRSIRVAHRGFVTGEGELSVIPEAKSSLVIWAESLRFPWWVGGGVTAWVARPILRRMWAKNLKTLADLFAFEPRGPLLDEGGDTFPGVV